jgi:hypothetical protein
VHRTEDDIRRAFDVEPDAASLVSLRSFAASLDEPANAALRRTRRRLLPVAAAAVVVMIAAAGVAVVSSRGDKRDRPSGGSVLSPEQLRPVWDIAVRPVSGFSVSRVFASSQQPEAGTYALVAAASKTRPESGSIASCLGTVQQCVKTAVGVSAQPIEINGRPGSFYPGQHVAQNGLINRLYRRPWTAAYENHDFQPMLIWRADDDTTISITGTFGFEPTTYDYDNARAREVLLRLAGAVSAGRRDPIVMPFALRDLPSHLAPEAVALGRGNHCIGYGRGQGPRGEWVGSVMTACRVATGTSRAATIKAADDINPAETAGVAVHDFPDGTSVVVEVDSGRQRLVSRTQAQRLADRADVSPRLADESSWIPVD